MSFDYRVADLSLAELGRREIDLAQHEMPGLMAVRREWAAEQPLRGARILLFRPSPLKGYEYYQQPLNLILCSYQNTNWKLF